MILFQVYVNFWENLFSFQIDINCLVYYNI